MARYIDADKLYKRVKEKTNPYGKPTLDYESGLKVLGMIEQELTADVVEVKHGKWIDVKDRLPKLDTEVIVATESMVFCAMRRKHDRRHFWTNAVWNYMPIESFTGKILFWMPLPEHPRIRKENK